MTRTHASNAVARDAGFGIYVHWPFCAQKCPYCDFNSHVRFKGWDEARFLAAYKRELETIAAHVPKHAVSSIFFGGGTPSLMQGATVAAILDHIAQLWPVADHAEVTLEANPGSVEVGRFRDFRAAGVNRVSIGVQSLIEADLKALGRIHTVAEAKAAVALADKIFDRFSFDLIYARPKQTRDAWHQELKQGLAMAGAHLSLYQLTIEDGTPFADRHKRGQLIVPDDDAALELFDLTQQLTMDAGLPAYEISNHARPGEESQHNLIYWRYGSYVGVGPGAHGRVVWDGARQATATRLNPEEWCAAVEQSGHGLRQQEPLRADQQADEFLLMGLRLSEGIDGARYQQICGRAMSHDVINELIEQGYLEFVPAMTTNIDCADAQGQNQDDGGDGMFGGTLRACIGPGLGPSNNPGRLSASIPHGKERSDKNSGRAVRLRATAKGRFVLNQIVYQLASNTEPGALIGDENERVGSSRAR